MTLKKSDLIKILVEEYGYEKEDLKFDAESKPYTNAKLQALIDAEKEDAEVFASQSKRIKVQKSKKFKDEDLIPVMNGLSGGLFYQSDRTHKVWEFKGFGQESAMEFSELINLRNKYPAYFMDGWLIVCDDDVVKELNLASMYENILTPKNVKEVFEKPIEEMEKFVDRLPQGMKITFVDIAKDLYNKEELDSVKVIRFIEDKFKFSLDDLSPVNDIAQVAPTIQMGNKRAIIVDKR
ncbi:hypothetical protein PQE70_gp226 [Bacillus phage vB_BanS_Nate]|uniref:Uncharacterized protein n=1 Tax=Bacillus phage vB_BanS_Nate TaxID=2894788 RepID=A0AAE8YY49_9CAUD|nr:hypothetical protein PQE70_gp226 [Bacillus phage vB_BanS_Nate]UGO51079.1 hypothetical protein NATE_226 [Bacillus phage vB_BanS_Nate]